MSWPAPNVTPLPPPSAPPIPTPREPSELSRLLAAVPPAAWVAVLGAALVVIAAGIVVTSSWGAHAPTIRALTIVLVTGGLAWASERGRALVPVSSTVTAHVASILVAPAGISVVSMFGATWPLCLLVGGALMAGVTDVQSRRWPGSVHHAGQVGAIAMAATGLAALTGTTGGIISGIVAVGLVTGGAYRRAAALAVLAVASPLLWALTDAGIGAGTFERAGLVGERLGWSGPTVGLLAAIVLAIAARAVGSNVLMLGAGLSVVSGVVTGLAAIDGHAVLWWSVPALVVLAIEASWWMLPGDAERAAVVDQIDLPAVPFAVLACGSPLLVWFADHDGEIGIALVPTTVTAAALALSWFRWRGDGRLIADVAGAAVAAVGVTAAIALDAHSVIVAAVAVGATAISWAFSREHAPLALYVPAAWAVLTIASAGDSEAAWSQPALVGVLAALSVLVVGVRSRRAADRPERGWFELGAVVVTLAGAATGLVGTAWEVVMLGATALLIMLAVGFERRLATWACMVAGVVATVATLGAIESSPAEPTLWIGWSLLAASLSAVGARARSMTAFHAASAAAVGTITAAATSVPVETEQVIMSALIGSVTLTGLAIAIARRSPLDTAAVATTLVALGATSLDVDPMWSSAVWFFVGLQLVAAGVAVRQPLAQLGGSILAAGAALSTWFTSGANAWFVEVIVPAGITAGDLWMLAATGSAFAAGIAARRTLAVSSWIAYSAGFLIVTIWLAVVVTERNTVWALPFALTIGMASAVVGAWRRLAAVLVGGSALVVAVLVAAIGDELTDVPTWAWLAVGGLGLLGVAVLIERMGRKGIAGLKELAEPWQ